MQIVKDYIVWKNKETEDGQSHNTYCLQVGLDPWDVFKEIYRARSTSSYLEKAAAGGLVIEELTKEETTTEGVKADDNKTTKKTGRRKKPSNK